MNIKRIVTLLLLLMHTDVMRTKYVKWAVAQLDHLMFVCWCSAYWKNGFLTRECHYFHQPRSSICHFLTPSSIHVPCQSRSWYYYWWIPLSNQKHQKKTNTYRFIFWSDLKTLSCQLWNETPASEELTCSCRLPITTRSALLSRQCFWLPNHVFQGGSSL